MAGANVVHFLADKLGSFLEEKLKEEVSLVVTFKEEFEYIYYEIRHIKSMLHDAGEQTNSETMMIWQQNLREVLTKAMDLVEDCEQADNPNVSVFQQWMSKHHMSKIPSLDRMVRKFIFKNRKGREIRELKKRIDKINGTANKYLTGLKSFVDVKPFSENERGTFSSPFLEKDQIVGRKEDIDAITEKILQENGPRVITVWGMGGLGKTCLVRHVFDSELVQNGFKHLVWVLVSEKFKIDQLLHSIALQIKLPGYDLSTNVSTKILKDNILSYLQGERASVFVRLGRYFTKKPFLLVLDDVWDKDVLHKIGFDDVWNKNSKNKIVVITRDKRLSNAMGTHAITHEMKYLSDKESLELFCKHAFSDPKLPEHLDYSRPDILNKCTRLPKAVEAIAKSMARVSMIENHWEMALSGLNREEIIERRVLPTLRSSYDALPHHLKACFLYFASFPPNTKIKTESLMYAWLAHFRDILPGVGSFDVAWSYLDQLVELSVIEASEFDVDGRVSLCQMKEFFHGLALSESKKEAKCLLETGQGLRDFPVVECKHARRISLTNTHIHRIKKTIKCPDLRILILCDNTRLTSIFSGFFDKLKYLAVLDLSKTGIKSLPSSIGKLKRVKFLNLSRTKIEKLPESLSSLRSLISLDVSNCEDLRKLHSGIGGHKFMLNLNMHGCKNLESLPSGISKLCSLRSLRFRGFVFNSKPAANAFGWAGFNDLTDLQRLSVSFNSETSSLEGVLSLQTWARMEKMRDLSLHYMSSGDECYTLQPGLRVMERLEKLHLHKLLVSTPASTFWEYHLQNLKELKLECDDSYGGSYYKGIEKIPNLKKLWLLSNKKCVNFPNKFGETNAFPKLGELIIDDFKNLECFPSLKDNAMPLLKYLRITNCSHMKDMPSGLDKLKSLTKIRLDPAFLKWHRYPQIKNASGTLISYVVQQKGYPEVRDASGSPVKNIIFEETDQPIWGSSKRKIR